MFNEVYTSYDAESYMKEMEKLGRREWFSTTLRLEAEQNDINTPLSELRLFGVNFLRNVQVFDRHWSNCSLFSTAITY